MKFILSRTDDIRIHSKKWVVGYGLLLWLISRIVAMLLMLRHYWKNVYSVLGYLSRDGKWHWLRLPFLRIFFGNICTPFLWPMCLSVYSQ